MRVFWENYNWECVGQFSLVRFGNFFHLNWKIDRLTRFFSLNELDQTGLNRNIAPKLDCPVWFGRFRRSGRVLPSPK